MKENIIITNKFGVTVPRWQSNKEMIDPYHVNLLIHELTTYRDTLIKEGWNAFPTEIARNRILEILKDSKVVVGHKDCIKQRWPGVYVFVAKHDDKNGDLCKIGCSGNIRDRLRQHMSDYPDMECHFVILTDHERELEKAFHEYLKSVRITGEWFDLDEMDHLDIARMILPERFKDA